MSFKRAFATVIAAGTIATIGVNAVTPKSISDVNNPEEQGGHAQQNTNQRLRQEGNSAGDAEYHRQFVPVEPRPAEVKPKLPFKIVP